MPRKLYPLAWLLLVTLLLAACNSSDSSSASSGAVSSTKPETASASPASTALHQESGKPIDLPNASWESAWKELLQPIQDEFNQANAQMGHRSDSLLRILQVSFDNFPTCEMLIYRTIIEHSRGGAEYTSFCLIDEYNNQALIKDLAFYASEKLIYIGQEQDWLIFYDEAAEASGPYFAAHLNGKVSVENLKSAQAPEQLPTLRPQLNARNKWELQGASGTFPISAENQAAIAQASSEPLLLPNNEFVVFLSGDGESYQLEQYMYRKDWLKSHIQLYPGSQGLSGLIAAPENPYRMAFANVNFAHYPEGGQLFGIEFSRGEMITKKKFPLPILPKPLTEEANYDMEAGQDFWWVNDTLLQYQYRTSEADTSYRDTLNLKW